MTPLNEIQLEYAIIVHGGAWSIPDEVKNAHLEGVRKACENGFQQILNNINAVDVAEYVIKELEDDPTFDAGIGSHLSDNGEVEMDAIIADDKFNIGSVCAIKNVKNPISVAKLIMEKTEHILLAGEGATKFAIEQGIDFFPTENLLVGREKETYEKIRNSQSFSTKDPFKPEKQGFGTVGVCVLDTEGNFAIGVSTGGTPFKMTGRVGDTPIWGAGGYVNKFGATAATGFGEDLLRVLISKTVNDEISKGKSAQDASDMAIKRLEELTQGLGGVITLAKNSIGLSFNTKRMAFAVQSNLHPLCVGIERDDVLRFKEVFK